MGCRIQGSGRRVLGLGLRVLGQHKEEAVTRIFLKKLCRFKTAKG